MTHFPPQAPGSVLLVGAGPGDLGLLTVTGLRALERAEVIVADRLGARTVIDQLEQERGAALDAEIIDVGKQPGHHPVPQNEINAILVEQAKRGLRVVRLKGGDPFVFGRGGEEIAHVRAAGIDVHVVPGCDQRELRCRARRDPAHPPRRRHLVHGRDRARPAQ